MTRTMINLEVMSKRGVLDDDDRKLLDKERNGWNGERLVGEVLQKVLDGRWFTSNILLEHDQNYIQLDHVIITRQRVIILEVKNHRHDYEVRSGKWYFQNGREVSNPLNQLERAKSILAHWLQRRKIYLQVHGYIVWTGDSHIFGLQPDDAIIKMTKLARIANELQVSDELFPQLHEVFLTDQLKTNPFYHHRAAGQLKNGFNCPSCYCLSLNGRKQQMKCIDCRTTFSISEVIYTNMIYYCSVHNVHEFSIRCLAEFFGDYFTVRTLQLYIRSYVEAQRLIKINRTTYRLPETIDTMIKEHLLSNN
ncbi:nuclease-related domain-containing protein [Macrococcus equipercicus]|uniref:NERD domain-containing protein n=1 Tax=Macrococcus equipercicus TaxID=69967 RepID=A0A9Q9BVC6_9STAP|nr:nuclease-related domain-containing protein [Macrococcus equipercicus]UTH13042.1 NERD domain-containing protein [Macrococcus equipercicus]